MSATEEFNKLVNNRNPSTSHPEDYYNSDSEPHTSDQEASHSQNDSSDEDNMVSSRAPTYHIPRTVHEANTGPKGVIADAQAFERARKKSFRRTLLDAARFENGSPFSKSSRETSPTDKSSSAEEDDEDRFMEKWRTSRMQHLQRKNRRPSPRGKQFGKVDLVNASEYLDAIEKVTANTVVVVCIYDEQVCCEIYSLQNALTDFLYSLMIALLSRNVLVLSLDDRL